MHSFSPSSLQPCFHSHLHPNHHAFFFTLSLEFRNFEIRPVLSKYYNEIRFKELKYSPSRHIEQSFYDLQHFLIKFFRFLFNSFNQMINIFCFPIVFISLSSNYSPYNLKWTIFGELFTRETNKIFFFESNVHEQYSSNVLYPKQIISILEQ